MARDQLECAEKGISRELTAYPWLKLPAAAPIV